jgi:hypothetical protein
MQCLWLRFPCQMSLNTRCIPPEKDLIAVKACCYYVLVFADSSRILIILDIDGAKADSGLTEPALLPADSWLAEPALLQADSWLTEPALLPALATPALPSSTSADGLGWRTRMADSNGGLG